MSDDNVGADCVRPERYGTAPTHCRTFNTRELAALPAANQPVPGGIPARILNAMQPGREYSRADLLAATGINEADCIWAIRQLKEQGRVVQQGEKRGAQYVKK